MKTKLLITLLCLLTAVAFQPAFAQDDEEIVLSGSADVSFANIYIWRGLALTDGPVMQPSLTLGAGGLSLNAWGNFELDDVNDNEFKFTEIDLTADYAFELEMVTLNIGVIYYTFPNTDFDSTLEFYVSAALNTIISPSVTVYKDVDLVEGMYANFGLGYDLPIEDSDVTVSLAANAGWGDEDHNLFYYGAAEATFTDLLLSGSVSIPLTDQLSLGGMLAWSNLLSDEIEANFEEPDNFIGAISASWAF